MQTILWPLLGPPMPPACGHTQLRPVARRPVWSRLGAFKHPGSATWSFRGLIHPHLTEKGVCRTHPREEICVANLQVICAHNRMTATLLARRLQHCPMAASCRLFLTDIPVAGGISASSRPTRCRSVPAFNIGVCKVQLVFLR